MNDQREYDKFCDWFYKNTSSIDYSIWCLVFGTKGKEDFLYEKDVYTLFMKINEIEDALVKKGIKRTENYIRKELNEHREIVKKNFEEQVLKCDSSELAKVIEESMKETTDKAVAIVMSAYKSIETMLMGIAVFKIGEREIDCEEYMMSFQDEIDRVLEHEKETIIAFYRKEKEACYEKLFVFPEMKFQ